MRLCEFWTSTANDEACSATVSLDPPTRCTSDGPAPVAQGIERRFPKPCVAGSNPAGGANVFAFRAKAAPPASAHRRAVRGATSKRSATSRGVRTVASSYPGSRAKTRRDGARLDGTRRGALGFACSLMRSRKARRISASSTCVNLNYGPLSDTTPNFRWLVGARHRRHGVTAT